MRAYRSSLRIALFLTLGSIAAVVAVAGGCSPNASSGSTKVTSSMQKPMTGQPPLRKVLVVGMLSRDDLRRQMEDQFANEMKARGVEAIPGHTLMVEPNQVTPDRLKQEAQRVGADAIVVAGLVRRETRTVTEGGMAVGGRGEYPAGFPALSYESYDQPPMTTEERVAIVDTKIYDAKSTDPLWTARTETIVMTDPSKDIPGFVRAIVKQMEKDRVIP